jgi:hypothetical protein
MATDSNPFSNQFPDGYYQGKRNGYVYFHVQRIANVYHFYSSVDGIHWFELSGTLAKPFVVANVFFHMSIETGSNLPKQRTAIDWVRRDLMFL